MPATRWDKVHERLSTGWVGLVFRTLGLGVTGLGCWKLLELLS